MGRGVSNTRGLTLKETGRNGNAKRIRVWRRREQDGFRVSGVRRMRARRWLGQCICGAWNTMVEEKVIDLDIDDKRRRSSAMAGAGRIAGRSGAPASGRTSGSGTGVFSGAGSAAFGSVPQSAGRAGRPVQRRDVISGENGRMDTGIGELQPGPGRRSRAAARSR